MASRNSSILLVSVCTSVPYSRNGSCPPGHNFCTVSVRLRKRPGIRTGERHACTSGNQTGDRGKWGERWAPDGGEREDPRKDSVGGYTGLHIGVEEEQK